MADPGRDRPTERLMREVGRLRELGVRFMREADELEARAFEMASVSPDDVRRLMRERFGVVTRDG